MWSSFEADEQAGKSNHLDGVLVAYDGRTTAYTSRHIPIDDEVGQILVRPCSAFAP